MTGTEDLGRVRSSRDLLGSLAEGGGFLGAAEREELTRRPFYVVETRARWESGGEYGAQCAFVVAVPDWLAPGERRLLTLGWNPTRERFARELERELRAGADAVGPYVLEKRSTRSGNEAWRFVPAPDGDPAAGETESV